MTKDLTIYKGRQPARRRIPPSELARTSAAIEYLTEDEYLRLYEAAKHPEHQLLIRLLYESGLRISEALALKFSDIYPDAVNVRHGKGNKQRTVAMQAPVLGDLMRHAQKTGSTDRIFVKLRHRSAANSMLIRAACDAGISKKVHPHLFRHTYAINFIRQTGNPWALQSQGGWSNMEIIKTYMRLAGEMPKEAVAKMIFPKVG